MKSFANTTPKLFLAAASIIGLSLTADAAAAVDGATAAKRPNIVVIVSDDHRADCLGYFKHPDLKTPNIDRLAERGVVFRHAYVSGADQGAVCLPSRTQLHSGRNLYHWTAKRPAETEPEGYSLGRAFRAAGYATLRSGKSGSVPSKLNAEFERNVEESKIPFETHLTNAISFIRENAGQRPFLLVFEPRVPHSPYPATEKFRAMYPPAQITLPPEFLASNPLQSAYTPAWTPDNGAPAKGEAWTAELARKTLARYFASISYLDDGVGQVIQALREAGVEENTYVVFVGDNGFSISHHGLFSKADVYENGGLHVPLLIAGPRIAHRDSAAFAYMIDLFPTVCDLADVPIPMRVDGLSLAPVVRGGKEKIRCLAFTAFCDEQFSVRDERWKLIRFPKKDLVQLYDLKEDPRELTDLSGAPSQAQRITQLTELMEREKIAAGYVWPIQQGSKGDKKGQRLVE